MNTRSKQFTTCSLFASAAAFLAGCVVTSVYPFYTDKDLTFEPALAGQWTKTQDEKESWAFEQEGQKGYRLTLVSGDKTNVIQAHLFKLRGETFLDLYGTDLMPETQPPPIPSHLLLRVFQLTPTIKLAAMNHEWLGGELEKNPKAIRHHQIKAGGDSKDYRLVLTAETPELQKFVIKYLGSEEAWKDTFELSKEAAGRL